MTLVAAPSAGRRQALATLSGAGLGLALHGALAAAEPRPVVWPAVRTLDGQSLSAPWLQGRATLLVFFSTNCPYCRRHITRLTLLQQRLPALPMQVLLAAQDSPAAAVPGYLAERGWRFATTLDSAALHAALSQRRVVPLTCMIDRAGLLREVIPGEMAEDDVLGLARWAQA